MPAANAARSRRVVKAILLGFLGAKAFTSVPVGIWESNGLGPAADLSLDLAFALCLTSTSALFGWSRTTAWKGGAITLVSFSVAAAAALLLWRFGQAPTDDLDLWIRWFRLSALSLALLAIVAAFGPPVVRTDS